jgi:hypothetical protein
MAARLRVLALLILAPAVVASAQSLGDVAREIRSEEQKAGAPHPKVITNEDVVRSAREDQKDISAKPTTRGQVGNVSVAEPTQTPSDENSIRDLSGKREARELETQRRTDEINKVYKDQIASLRDQINNAQVEIGKLQGDYENRWNIPQRYPPSEIHFRDMQALYFNNQVSELIEAQRRLIVSLNSQLEKVQEEARHAGVPHATD